MFKLDLLPSPQPLCFICKHCGKKNSEPWGIVRMITKTIIAETPICNFCDKQQRGIDDPIFTVEAGPADEIRRKV